MRIVPPGRRSTHARSAAVPSPPGPGCQRCAAPSHLSRRQARQRAPRRHTGTGSTELMLTTLVLPGTTATGGLGVPFRYSSALEILLHDTRVGPAQGAQRDLLHSMLLARLLHPGSPHKNSACDMATFLLLLLLVPPHLPASGASLTNRSSLQSSKTAQQHMRHRLSHRQRIAAGQCQRISQVVQKTPLCCPWVHEPAHTRQGGASTSGRGDTSAGQGFARHAG